jgi:hypothetical protein
VNAPASLLEGSIETWLKTLDDWYTDIANNSHYREQVYCHFERSDSSEASMTFSVVLTPTSQQTEPATLPELPATPLPVTNKDRQKPSRTSALNNDRPAIAALLPTRAEARGRVVVKAQSRPATPEIPPDKNTQANKPAREIKEENRSNTSDFKAVQTYNFNIDNNLAGYSFKIASSSALNEDLLKVLVLGPPPTQSNACVSLPAMLSPEMLKSDPCFNTEGGRYGILLRAALVAKVTGSKANLALYINRLEDLRALFREASKLPLSLSQRATLTRSLWRLLDEVRESDPVIPADLKTLPETLRQQLSNPSKIGRSTLSDLAWYGWNFRLPYWISKHISALTRCGHLLAYAAFASLLLLALHPALDFTNGAMSHWLAQLSLWRSQYLPDAATLAITFAASAGAIYALATRRLTMPERVALSINDKIEEVLDSTLADLMKANMDVQIGRLGRGEAPGLVPESIARKLDNAFALKDMVNSYESTVRARRRHVAAEVGKAQHIRLESHQRLRNAALGVTASFVLLEIGGRIQEHRDLQAGTDSFSYFYWLKSDNRIEGTAAKQGETPAVTNVKTLDCARTEIAQQQPASPECLTEWRDSALASSSQLLFLVFLIAMLMFIVRVIRRVDQPNAS